MLFCWNEINFGIKFLIFILCIFFLMILFLWDDVVIKFFYVVGIIFVLYFLMILKKIIINNFILLIFILLCFLGIINIIWYLYYKVLGFVYINVYCGLMEIGKIVLCSVFIFLVFFVKNELRIKIKFGKLILFVFLVTQLFFFVYVMW